MKKEKKEASVIAVAKIAMKKWLKPHWRIMMWATFANVLVGLATGAFPVFVQKSLNILFDANSPVPVYVVSLAVFSLLTLRAGATFGGNFLNGYANIRITTSVQHELLQHFILADFHTINKQHSGRLVASFMQEARQVDGLIGGQMILFFRQVVTLIGVLGGMIYINWQLSFFVLGALPIVFFFIFSYGKAARKHFGSSLTQTGDVNKQIVEMSQGAKIIRAYGTERLEIEQSRTSITELVRKLARVERARSASGPSAEFFVGFGMAALFFYVGYEGRAGNFSQGDLVGFMTAMLLIYQPMKSVANVQVSFQMAALATERILEMLAQKRHIVSLPNAPPLQIKEVPTGPRISFKNVSFAYPDTKVKVLKNTNLDIEANEFVALVGPSGGGKSTIFNLLERLYDVSEGVISIDQQDIRKVDLESLRRSMSLVLQDIFMFDDSIARNISYAEPDASEENITRAAKMAYAHDFIEKMPLGYEARVGETGNLLSGGQRQRISFARAALRDSPILLLDEPTSSLDAESEEAVQKAIRTLVKNRTVMIIAHRFSTIKNADRIVVLQEGEIVEQGTHDSLVKNNQLYRKLYDTQFTKDDVS